MQPEHLVAAEDPGDFMSRSCQQALAYERVEDDVEQQGGGGGGGGRKRRRLVWTDGADAARRAETRLAAATGEREQQRQRADDARFRRKHGERRLLRHQLADACALEAVLLRRQQLDRAQQDSARDREQQERELEWLDVLSDVDESLRRAHGARRPAIFL